MFRREEPLDAALVETALRDRYQQLVASKAAIQEGKGSRLGLYFREVALHAMGEVPHYFSTRVSHGVMIRCLWFRLGCHHLRVHTRRWQSPRLPRQACTCLRCDTHDIDDEAHCLLVCTHPTVLQHRIDFQNASPGLADLGALHTCRQFWQTFDTCGLPQAVHYIATCVRVAWHCHKSAGDPAAIDLTSPVLDGHLDLFDDESHNSLSESMLDDYSDGEELVEVFPTDSEAAMSVHGGDSDGEELVEAFP